MRLLYIKNTVGLAKLSLPHGSKIAMDIAQVDGFSEFPLANINSKNMAGVQGTTVNLNDAPFKIKEEHLNWPRALSKTVELGKRFFPRCSKVLNKIMDADDLSNGIGLTTYHLHHHRHPWGVNGKLTFKK